MKTVLIGLGAVLMAGAAHAQGTGTLKPGLWEARALKMTNNGVDMLPQMKAAQEQMRQAMANMPPEQRKQMEATLGAQGNDPAVQRMCVSPEMAKTAEAGVPQMPAGAGCAEPKINRSGDRVSFDLSCKQGGVTIVTKGETVMAGDRGISKVESVTTMPDGKKNTMLAETQMQFMGSDCGGLKPADQIARDMQSAGRAAAPKK